MFKNETTSQTVDSKTLCIVSIRQLQRVNRTSQKLAQTNRLLLARTFYIVLYILLIMYFILFWRQ